jgi:tRNA/tmRNA/rRNA uracil-C5-methylase (TrmA/RlmC/RlmD family)
MGRLAQSPTERAQLFRLDSFVSLARNQALPTLICEGVPPFLTGIAEELMARLPEVVGVAAARSRGRTTMHRSPSGSVRGKSRLVETLGEYEYHVSADSFFQVNPAQATRMLALVEEWAQMGKHDSVIDAYCGVGTFLLPLAKGGGPALGIEAEDAALADARLNAKVWHLRNADIERGKVERVLPGMVREGAHCDVVVLDPPPQRRRPHRRHRRHPPPPQAHTPHLLPPRHPRPRPQDPRRARLRRPPYPTHRHVPPHLARRSRRPLRTQGVGEGGKLSP